MKSRIQTSARFLPSALCLLFSLLANHASAVVSYWDPIGNWGSYASFTGDLSGTWENASWSRNATGLGGVPADEGQATPQAFTESDGAVFGVGTGLGTPAFTVTMNNNHTIAGFFIGDLNPNSCDVTVAGSGIVTIPSGLQGFDIANSSDTSVGILRFNVVLTGPGTPTMEKTGTVYLRETNTYTGGTSLGYSGAPWTGLLYFNNDRAFGTGPIIVARAGGALLIEGSSARTITNAVTCTNTINIVANPNGLTFTGPWSVGAFTPTVGSGNAAANVITISGVISGTGGFTKDHTGIMKFTAANTYSGVTTVNNGILQLGDGVSLNGSVAGTITTTSPGTIVFANPNAQSYAKAIGGTGAFTKQAAGVLTLTVADTYAGATTISAGTLKLGVANAIPSGSGKGNVSLAGTLDLGGFSCAVNGLNGAGTVDNSTGTATYTLTAGNNGASSTFSGVIKNTSGTVALTKATAGTLTLSGVNTYAGATTVSGGTLQLGVDNAVPAASTVIVANAATLDMNNFNDTIAALSGAGSVINNNATLTVNGNSAIGANTQNFNGFSCIAGMLSGGGTLVKGGTHAMAVRGDNSSYVGPITLSAGTLSVGAAPDRLPTGLALSVPSAALFQLDANSQTVSTLNGSGSVNLGGGSLTINQGGSDSFSGVLQNSELAGSSTALGHGLRGYYYTNVDFTGLGTVRDDSTVNLADMSALPGYSPSAKTNQVSVRWLGKVLTTVAGDYIFTTKCDDGSRLWVNGTLLVDNWTTQGATAKSGTNTLAVNAQYDIVMEYFNNTAGGAAQLFWTPPGDSSVIIPSSNLLLPGPGTLVKNGAGTEQLTGSSTYTGGTTVNVGTLKANAGALGSGNVTVASATLELDASTAISSAADLIATGDASVNLAYSGTHNIHAISLNGGATYGATGTYGAVSSGALHQDAIFAGSTGLLNVTASLSTNVLTASPGSPTYGATVTLTSTITGPGATPTGTVNFYDGANLLGSSPVVSGVATFSVNNLLVITSPHSLTTVYGGDSSHATSTSVPLSVSTTQATLVPTVVIATKIYDGTNTATIAFLGGMLASDSNYVHIATGYTATFADKDVANGKSVSVTGMVLAGSLSGNYTFSTTSVNTTGNITPKALTVTGITANPKVYDATTTATIVTTAATLQAAEAAGTGTTADGKPYTGDTVALNTAGASGTFADANVATGKTVTINGLTPSGAQAGDYTVTPPTTTANITKASSQDLFASSPNPSSLGANVTFTATLSANPPTAAIPTGNVIFVTNNVVLGTNALVSGVASTNTASLPLGFTTVEARYNGDANFIGITNSLLQAVNSSTCSSTNRILSVTQNGGNSFTLNLIGTYQAQYYILSQTNVAQPMVNWKPVPGSTNTVSDPGGHWSVTVTNPAPAFYRARAMSVCP